MTNKELQDKLKEFPDDIEVYLDRNGSIYTECGVPQVKRLNSMSMQNRVLVLWSPIKLK